jgi:hypothetical protein
MATHRGWFFARRAQNKLTSFSRRRSKQNPDLGVDRSCSNALRHHTFLGQFLFRILVFGKVREAHPAQHVRCLGELDVFIADDLNPITPGVAKVEETSGEQRDTSRLERLESRLLVIDDQTEMATIVRGLLTAFLKRNKLIA